MEITVPFPSYKYLRFLAVFAGILGVAQSLAWLGLSIVAILGYYCNISFTDTTANFGSVLSLTIYQMYFRGDCTPSGWPTIDFTAIQDLDLMTPQTVNIFMWVVASLHLLWLFSSVTMITNVKKSNIKYINVFLYLWVLITLVISIIDLVLFVLFIIDYNTIFSHSFGFEINFAQPTQVILVTAQNTAGMMASISMRGYFLWLINVILVIYLFTQTFKISDYNRLSGIQQIQPHGETNNAFKNDNDGLQDHPIFNNQPINAYEMQPSKQNSPWYNYLTTEIPRAHRPKSYLPQQQQAMTRSKSTSNLDESFQKRMTTANGGGVILRRDQAQNRSSRNYTQTPPEQNHFDSRPPIRSNLRSSRY